MMVIACGVRACSRCTTPFALRSALLLYLYPRHPCSLHAHTRVWRTASDVPDLFTYY
jgi:hypothetical protein